MKNIKKNNATRSGNEVFIEEGFLMLNYINKEDSTQHVVREINHTFIQFHFGLKGHSIFYFNENNYKLNLNKDKTLLLYNPQKALSIHVAVQSGAAFCSILISIRKFHALFSDEAGYVNFLNGENRDKKYYSEREIPPDMSIVLHQLLHTQMHPSVRKLYLKAKMYELLSLYFNKTEGADTEYCPFLTDEENIMKIRKAKNIMIGRMTAPPGLQELANVTGLSLKKLKVGFKQVYGTTIYGFLFDYKMEYARKLLEDGRYNVNEISAKVGYSTPSHFISGFRKKYGTTPKKYLMAHEKS